MICMLFSHDVMFTQICTKTALNKIKLAGLKSTFHARRAPMICKYLVLLVRMEKKLRTPQ